MKASRLALIFASILSIASIAQGISAVLVTDDAGMRALAESDNRGLIAALFLQLIANNMEAVRPSSIYISLVSEMIMSSQRLPIQRRGRTSTVATSPVLSARRSRSCQRRQRKIADRFILAHRIIQTFG
jgi:hypothetical protein